MNHTDNQYIEEQILLLIDGELDAGQEQAVREIIKQRKEYQELYESYLSVRMDADDEYICDFKDTLYKTATQPLDIPAAASPSFGRRQWWSVAAALVPVMLLSALWWSQSRDIVTSDLHTSMAKSQLPYSLSAPLPAQDSSLHKPRPSGKPDKVQRTHIAQVTKPAQQSAIAGRQHIPLINEETAVPSVEIVASHTITAPQMDVLPTTAAPEANSWASRKESPKGLLGDVINAGNWFFKEEKSTTVEISLGNVIHKSYTIRLK